MSFFLSASTGGVTSPMTAFLSTLGEVATAIWGQMASVSKTITETPMLLFTVGFLFVGGVVGIFGRLLSRN